MYDILGEEFDIHASGKRNGKKLEHFHPDEFKFNNNFIDRNKNQT